MRVPASQFPSRRASVSTRSRRAMLSAGRHGASAGGSTRTSKSRSLVARAVPLAREPTTYTAHTRTGAAAAITRQAATASRWASPGSGPRRWPAATSSTSGVDRAAAGAPADPAGADVRRPSFHSAALDAAHDHPGPRRPADHDGVVERLGSGHEIAVHLVNTDDAQRVTYACDACVNARRPV